MARAGLLVLACAFSGAGHAQQYAAGNLAEAVSYLVGRLVNEGRLSGQNVYVGADDFFEEENELRPPLSTILRTMSLRALTDRQVEVALVQAEAARVLHGRWRRESKTHLHLTLFIADPPRGEEEPLVRRSAEALVPVEGLRREDIEPTLRHWGERVVRRLERDLPGGERFRLHLAPLSDQGEALSERFGAYLLDRWRPAFTGSDRFTPVDSAESAEGVLHGEVYVVGEHVEVGLRIVDNKGTEVASDHVKMSRAVFPDGMLPPWDPRGLLAIESGVVSLNGGEFPEIARDGGSCTRDRGIIDRRIDFNTPFREPPTVIAVLEGMQVQGGEIRNGYYRYLRIKAKAEDIQVDGFTLDFTVGCDTILGGAMMNWFALGYR